MWLLKAFLRKARRSDAKGAAPPAHPPGAPGVRDTVGHGRVTHGPHVLLLCADFMLEFKQGGKGSH